MQRKNQGWQIIALCCVLIITGLMQSYYGIVAKKKSAIDEFQYLPNGTFLKGAALGFDDILADLLWIKALGYVGSKRSSNENYLWLDQLLRVVTTLNPVYEDPYEFGGIIFTDNLAVDRSIAILKKGMEKVPEHHWRYWYLPFFISFNYMYHKQDYKTAAYYLEIAAKHPGSPAYMPLLVSRLYANTDAPEVALPFLEEMLETTIREKEKEKLRRRIKAIRSKQVVHVLEQKKMLYEKIFGEKLHSLFQLVAHGFVFHIPQNPAGGGTYFLTLEGEIIATNGQEENMEVHFSQAKKREIEQKKNGYGVRRNF